MARLGPSRIAAYAATFALSAMLGGCSDDADILPRASSSTALSGKLGSGQSCEPIAISTLQSQWVPPHAPMPGACTLQEVQAVVDCYVPADPNSETICKQPVSQRCLGCMVTAPTAAAYGPLVATTTDDVDINIPACIGRMAGDISATSCAAKMSQLRDCQLQACEHCPEEDAYLLSDPCMFETADPTMCKPAFETCIEKASAGVCKTLADQVNRCTAPYMEACTSGTSWSDITLRLGKMFCL